MNTGDSERSDEFYADQSDEGGRQIAPFERVADVLDRTIAVRIPELTANAAHCLIKALKLAKELNHSEVAVAHFVAAMTVLPGTAVQFSFRGLDPDNAFRLAMDAIASIERTSLSPREPPLSIELNSILSEAERVSEIHDHQQVSIDDILGIMTKHESSARRLLAGKRPITPSEEMRDALTKLNNDLIQRLDRISNQLGELPVEKASEPDAGILRTLSRQISGLKGRP